MLLDLRGLFLLTGFQQPREVIFLQILHVLVPNILRDLNTLIPLVQLLIHLHRVLRLVILHQNGLRAAELLLQHRQLRLNLEVADPVVFPGLLLIRLQRLIHLPQIPGLANVAQGRKTVLRHAQILLLQRELRQRPPIRLRLRVQLNCVKNIRRLFQISRLDREPELNLTLVEGVGNRVVAVVHNDLGFPAVSLDVLDVALDAVERHLVGVVDRVPHAQISAVLRYHDLGIGDPNP